MYLNPSLKAFIYLFLFFFILKSTVILQNNISFNFFSSAITRLDSIIFGGLASIVYQKFHDKLTDKKTVLISLAALPFFLSAWCFKILQLNSTESWIWVVKIFYFLTMDFGIILTFPLFLIIKAPKILANIFKFFANISYGLYLYHISVLIQVHHNLGINGIYAYKCFWVYSVLISALLYFIFEKPIMDFKNKFTKSTNARKT